MGSLFSLPLEKLETSSPEAVAASGLKGSWTKVGKCPKQRRDGRSYADVARSGVEQGSLSKLRAAHFTKKSSKTHAD